MKDIKVNGNMSHFGGFAEAGWACGTGARGSVPNAVFISITTSDGKSLVTHFTPKRARKFARGLLKIADAVEDGRARD